VKYYCASKKKPVSGVKIGGETTISLQGINQSGNALPFVSFSILLPSLSLSCSRTVTPFLFAASRRGHT